MSNDYVDREVPVVFYCEGCGRRRSAMYVLRLPATACTLTDYQTIECRQCGNEIVLKMHTEQKNINHAVTTMTGLGKEEIAQFNMVSTP